eukprot:352815_1
MAKRIKKELDELTKHPIDNCSAGPVGDNLFEWQCVFLSQSNENTILSKYSEVVDNQSIHFGKITFPKDYPFKPMKIQFLANIDHPNINKDGSVNCNLLKQWLPSYTISNVLTEINNMLSDHKYLYVKLYKNFKNNIQIMNSFDLLREHPIQYCDKQNKISFLEKTKDNRIFIENLSSNDSCVHRYDARYDYTNQHNFIVMIPDFITKRFVKNIIVKYVDGYSVIGDIISEMTDPYFNGAVALSYLSHSDAYGCSMSYTAEVVFYFKQYKYVKFGVSQYYETGYEDEIEYNLLHKIPLKEQLAVITNHEKWSSHVLDDLLTQLPKMLWWNDNNWPMLAWNDEKLTQKR